MIFKNLYTNNISNIKKLNHWTEQLNDNDIMDNVLLPSNILLPWKYPLKCVHLCSKECKQIKIISRLKLIKW